MTQTDLEDAIANVARHLDPLFEKSVQSQYLDAHGRERPNPVPLEPPVGYKKQPSIADQMRAMIKQASYEAAMAGAESLEEADDFDVDEEFDPGHPYEHDFDIDPALDAMLALQSAPPNIPAPTAAAAPASPVVPQAPAPASPQAGPTTAPK